MIKEVEILKWNNYKIILGLVWQQGVFSYDSTSVFDSFFKVCGHIVQGHVPPSISCLFFSFQLIALEK
jgi:hypothetical protein